MTAPSFNISSPPPLTVKQVASRWGCSTSLVRKVIDSGSLRCFRLGSLMRINVSEVERYECEMTQAAQKPQKTTQSSASEADLPSSGTKTTDMAGASVVAASSKRQIGRAPRRKRAGSGKTGTVHLGPWAGS
ncbi:excisionase family DNA-binding protein [Novosphingobium sp. MBES04]|uniref:excisionase family DNA-binding protein n=1 Tax=Novosphingobium sp. MBES04 TaxID=1206458 RepID=UPI00057C7ECA|nr:excisionase family DNA-binding protein [Novosphingobium sp. MBES04]